MYKSWKTEFTATCFLRWNMYTSGSTTTIQTQNFFSKLRNVLLNQISYYVMKEKRTQGHVLPNWKKLIDDWHYRRRKFAGWYIFIWLSYLVNAINTFRKL